MCSFLAFYSINNSWSNQKLRMEKDPVVNISRNFNFFFIPLTFRKNQSEQIGYARSHSTCLLNIKSVYTSRSSFFCAPHIYKPCLM